MPADWPPPLQTTTLRAEQPLTELARQVLAEVGGVASARHIRDRLVALRDTPMSIRRVRDMLRAPRIRKLGAGYYAIDNTLFEPVLGWTERWVHTHQPVPSADVVAAIQVQYPRGDVLAIQRWLQQEPGRLQVTRGTVRYLLQSWRPS